MIIKRDPIEIAIELMFQVIIAGLTVLLGAGLIYGLNKWVGVDWLDSFRMDLITSAAVVLPTFTALYIQDRQQSKLTALPKDKTQK